MDPSQQALVVSQPVACPPASVYAFVRQMDKLPLWASGLAQGIEQRGGQWFAQSPMGEVGITMAPDNAFGVLDHDVDLPDGTTVHNAFRVTPCGDATSLLTFVVQRQPGMDHATFDADVEHVRRDLLALKRLLEGT